MTGPVVPQHALRDGRRAVPLLPLVNHRDVVYEHVPVRALRHVFLYLRALSFAGLRLRGGLRAPLLRRRRGGGEGEAQVLDVAPVVGVEGGKPPHELPARLGLRIHAPVADGAVLQRSLLRLRRLALRHRLVNRRDLLLQLGEAYSGPPRRLDDLPVAHLAQLGVRVAAVVERELHAGDGVPVPRLVEEHPGLPDLQPMPRTRRGVEAVDLVARLARELEALRLVVNREKLRLLRPRLLVREKGPEVQSRH